MFRVAEHFILLVILAMMCSNIVVAKETTKPNPDPISGLIVPVDGSYAGKTYSQLTEDWFQWVALQSPERDSIADPDGRFAAEGQKGNFWFLAGNYGGAVVRTITIPSGKAIFFPIKNIWAIDNDSPPVDPAYYWALIDANVAQTRTLVCEIDGVAVNNLDDFFARSRGYPDSWSAAFKFYVGPQEPPASIAAMVAGFWLLLQPLPPGEHTIHFASETMPCKSWVVDKWFHLGHFTLDVTYHITVTK